METTFTSREEIDTIYETLSETFSWHKTKPLEWRIVQLRKLWWMLEDNKERIAQALQSDLNKHELEAMTVDVCGIQTACLFALNNLKRWVRDEVPSRFHPFNILTKARVRKEPKGVAIIISAWNFPFMELFEPLVGAIAAGCCAVLKPSELAVSSQNLIMQMVPEYLDPSAIRVVTAGPKEMEHIMNLRWDHIFFTGSTEIGRIVYQAAAKHLTPVTLELGGQAPAIVSAEADVDLAAKRIAAGKFLNAGQVCLAVNHVFVDPKVKDEFLSALTKYFGEFLSSDAATPANFPHIVNERNFGRLCKLLDSTSGKTIFGGQRCAETLTISPTIVVDVDPSDSLMSQELFGPILPVLDGTLDDAIAYTTAHNYPLAIYPFTKSRMEKEKVKRGTRSGGMCVNDCMIHLLAEGAPFGGTGHSGMGSYHGIHGFNVFTHQRTVLEAPRMLEWFIGARYPPYSREKTAAMVRFFKPVTTVNFDREGNETLWSWPLSLRFWVGFGLFVYLTLTL